MGKTFLKLPIGENTVSRSTGAGTPIRPPHVPEDCRPVYQSYVVRLPGDPAPAATEVIRRMREDGVEVSIGTCHMPLTSFYRKRYNFQSGDFPATDRVAVSAISLPLHHHLNRAEQEQTVEYLLRHAGL